MTAVKYDNSPVRRQDRLLEEEHAAELLRSGKLVICSGCRDSLREFGLYRWDPGSGRDRVLKEHDHAMDDIRYFAAMVAAGEGERGGLAAGYAEREAF